MRSLINNNYLRKRISREIERMLVVIALIVTFETAEAVGPLDSVLNLLEREIMKLPEYTSVKEERLTALRKAFLESNSNVNAFNLAKELFDENVYYQSDSAYFYGAKMRDIALQMNDERKLSEAYVALMKCFSSNGYFKEASDMETLVKPELLSQQSKLDYYRSGATFYQNLESYAGGPTTSLGSQYNKRRLGYSHELSSVADSNSYLWQQNRIALDLIENPSLDKEISDRLGLLRRFNLDAHEKAIQHSLLGHAYLALDDRESAKYHLALSAMNDIRGNIHETTAAKMLAELLYEDNDLKRAHLLVHTAFDDASFYNSHLRRDELSKTMQLIDTARFNKRSNQLAVIVIVLIVFLFLLGVAIILFIKVRHRNKQIESVNKELHRKSEDLYRARVEIEKVNKELEATIMQLKEVSEIKDQYITESLHLNTVFVNQVEERLKNAMKLLKDKKYDELKFLPYQIGIKEERQRIFHSFDHAFLQLFPNFIDEFNKMFKEEDWISLDENDELPMDVRIFALLRLGIEDPTETAKYLNLSTRTVYVYKTKIKSKSMVDNNEFEEKIKAIPKP